MKIIDVHSHWGTRRGYPLRTDKELAQQRATWNSETRYHTEAEMAAYFRDSGVRAILDLGYAKYRPLEEMRALHDYVTPRQHTVTSFWVTGSISIRAAARRG